MNMIKQKNIKEEPSYTFANEDLDDVVLYDDGAICIELSGFQINEGQVFAEIWYRSIANQAVRISLNNIVVNGKKIKEYEFIDICPANTTWTSNRVPIEGVSTDKQYYIEFDIKVVGENEKYVGQGDKIDAYLDFVDEKCVVETGLLTKKEIIDHFSFLIDTNGRRKGNERAKGKWESDLGFIMQYGLERQSEKSFREISKYK